MKKIKKQLKWYDTLTYQETFDWLVTEARKCHYLQLSSGHELMQFDKIPEEDDTEIFAVLVFEGAVQKIMRDSTGESI